MRPKKTTYTFIYDPESDLIRTFTGKVRKKFIGIRLPSEDIFLELFGPGNIKFTSLNKFNYEVPNTFVINFGYIYFYPVET